MRKIFSVILTILLITVIFTACGKSDPSDAPEAVLELASKALEGECEKLSQDPFDIDIKEYVITRLELTDTVDITVNAINSTDIGAPSGEKVGLEIYKFEYEITPTPTSKISKKLEYNQDGKITGSTARAGAERYFIAYNCDGEYLELVEPIRFTAKADSKWKSRLVDSLFDVPYIDYSKWQELDEYSFNDGKTTFYLAQNYNPSTEQLANVLVSSDESDSFGKMTFDFEKLLVQTECYPTFNSTATFNPVIFMRTTTENGPKTHRGAYVGMSLRELKRIYPEDLYPMGDGRFAYLPEDETGRAIVFSGNGSVVTAIEMSMYESSMRQEAPYIRKNVKSSKFKVEAADVFHEEIILEGTEEENNQKTAKIDMKIPKISDETAGASEINYQIGIDWYKSYIQKLRDKDYSLVRSENLKSCKISYSTYNYGDFSALVLSEAKNFGDGSSTQNYRVWYYDAGHGRQISAEEYADGCDVKAKKILKKYNDQEGVTPVNNISEVPFYIDFSGIEYVLTNSGR
ncbi:MAG: hypothetical protein K6F52_00025 [Clostridia bacterium]|nr:hypothetical protein [Clostridia bacterium]